MYLFIKLTQATEPHKPVWINPAHISQMLVTESQGRTALQKASDEDAPIEVEETPDQVNDLIAKAYLIR